MATGDTARYIDLPPFANDILEDLAAKGARSRRQVVIDALVLLAQATTQNDEAARDYGAIYRMHYNHARQQE